MLSLLLRNDALHAQYEGILRTHKKYIWGKELTKIIRIDSRNPNINAIKEAANVIKGGGLVVYPTETCYGLGADALNSEAIRKVFLVKQRPFNQPLTAIVSDLAMWEKYAHLTPEALKLIREFLPGPLTIALKKRTLVPDIFDPSEFAARISSHPVAQALVEAVGSPIISTSSNLHGEPNPYTVTKALASLKEGVDLAIDCGVLPRRRISTIVHLITKPPRIVRAYPEGAIKSEAIMKALKGAE